MRVKTGPPVRRDDFLEREEDTRELWHRAERGHVLMLAPRRMGKTSLLHHMEDTPQPDWSCLFLSAESLETESQFVARLLKTISEAHPDGAWMERLSVSLRKVLRGIGQTKAGPIEIDLAEALKDEWRDMGAIVLKLMRELRGNTLVLVDEFPIFIRNLIGRSEVDGKRRAKLFLDWFREVRNQRNKEEACVHFVLTGSLGLDVVVKAVGLSGTINDLDSFTLGPLTPQLSRELLRRLSEGENLPLPKSVQDQILERIDWPIPFHLQLLFREVLSRVQLRGHSLNERLVEDAYESLLSADKFKHFSHWSERLDDPFLTPQERDLRRELLKAAARDRKGVSQGLTHQIRIKVAPDTDSEAVLLGLSHDGYLTHRNGRWVFSSSLLRDWWRKWQLKEPD